LLGNQHFLGGAALMVKRSELSGEPMSYLPWHGGPGGGEEPPAAIRKWQAPYLSGSEPDPTTLIVELMERTMSTKIYEAYRVKKDVNPFDLSSQIYKEAMSQIKSAIKSFFEKADADTKNFWEIKRLLFEGARLAASSPYKSTFDIKVGVNVFEDETHYYLIPYPGSGIFRDCLDFLKDFPGLEGYAYWNNSDHPESITDEQWAERGKTWDPIIDNWHRKLEISICDADCLYQFMPLPGEWAPKEEPIPA
jgi:hypothetical protein